MDEKKTEYQQNMSNEEYREELKKLFDGMEDNDLLCYFFTFVSEKIKRAL